MDLIITLMFLAVGFLSFIPVKNLFKYKKDFRYKCLKYLVNTAFVWTWIIIIERMATNVQAVYYLNLLTFPIKLLVSIFMLCTIVNYLGASFKKWMYYMFGFIAVADFVVSISNDFHMTMLKIDSTVSTKMDIWTATNGIAFYIHAIFAYSILIYGLVYLYVHVVRAKNTKSYEEISKAMFIGTILVVLTSISQILFNVPYDITYIAMVILVNNLYRAIFQNDMLFNLKTSGRVKVLSNMREMYIITDQNENIVEVSHLIEKEFQLEEAYVLTLSLQELLEKMKDKVIFHQSIKVGKELATLEKKHYHMKKKKFRLEGMRAYGYMILLYDESQVVELLRELNRLSNFDDMTGLHNRNFIENLLDEYDALNHPRLGVLSLDLNGLKTNNDYIGHDRGDYLLKELSKTMKQNAPDNSVLARVGGDEFIMIIEDTSPEQLQEVQKNIYEDSKQENIMDTVSVSIGSAFRNNKQTVFELMKEADQEMYKAKKKMSLPYSEALMRAINVDGYIR